MARISSTPDLIFGVIYEESREIFDVKELIMWRTSAQEGGNWQFFARLSFDENSADEIDVHIASQLLDCDELRVLLVEPSPPLRREYPLFCLILIQSLCSPQMEILSIKINFKNPESFHLSEDWENFEICKNMTLKDPNIDWKLFHWAIVYLDVELVPMWKKTIFCPKNVQKYPDNFCKKYH